MVQVPKYDTMLTMVKERDRFMGTHVMEEKILFSAAPDYHITLFQDAATTKILQ